MPRITLPGEADDFALLTRALRTVLAPEALLFDMDGVLYRGDVPLPWLPEFIAFLRGRPIPFILVTNNSTRTPEQYADKLARMDVKIEPAEVLTSGQATARYLARSYPPGTWVHVFGMDSLREAAAEEGFVLADEDVAVVVASMDRAVTYEKLDLANYFIRAGARFVATNLDPTQPTDEGLVPGTGSLIAALRAATEIEPLVIGRSRSKLSSQKSFTSSALASSCRKSFDGTANTLSPCSR